MHDESRVHMHVGKHLLITELQYTLKDPRSDQVCALLHLCPNFPQQGFRLRLNEANPRRCAEVVVSGVSEGCDFSGSKAVFSGALRLLSAERGSKH